MTFQPLARGCHVVGVGAGEHEALAALGVVEHQLLRNGATLRVAEHGRRVDAQMVEKARQVRGELRRRIGRRQSSAPPVATQVGYNHTMVRSKVLKHRLEHLAADHQAMHEQEGRPGPALSEVQER